jgi:subtilisin family serine protease
MRALSPTRLAALVTLVVLGVSLSAFAAEPADSWTFLPVGEIGAPAFLDAHPTYDGRGVVIFVLDTGVDMGTPGLTTTSTGEVKVIGARDFSGQGKLELKKSKWVENQTPRVLEVADGLRLEGFDSLAVAPSDSQRVWTGVLKESEFLNSASITDLNDNGSTDDQWGIVVYSAPRAKVVEKLGEGRGVTMRKSWGKDAAVAEAKADASENVWLCVIDIDRDGHLDDETILRDYATDLQGFHFRDQAVEKSRDRMTFALDLTGDDTPHLNLHHDDGGHGSHVSGMASGFSVHGQKGLNGVAPGAYVYSLKIGNNLLAGGSTTTESMKKAYDYAAKWMEEYKMPCCINMSYGIDSEIEGDARMDRYLDKVLDEHSKLVIVNSAGNSGPGISTVGLPAAADGVIAAGALFTKAMAKELYGATLEHDQLYVFSSRGGELAKPDVAAPGGASSSVPLWGNRDRYNGTSMASPMTTGSVACILSGLSKEGKSWNFGTIQRALRHTGKRLPGYTPIEVGGGVVDLPHAFDAARAYSEAGEPDELSVIKIRTEAPFQPDGKAPAAYWRGGWYPHDGYQQSFTITPRFPNWVSQNTRNKFYRAWRLKSEVPWIHLDRDETYINGDGDQTIRASYSGQELQEPGMHVGRIFAQSKGTGRSGDAAYDFEIVVTIVTPYEFGPQEGYTRSWSARHLEAGGVEHYFLRVPAGASAMRVKLDIPEGKEGLAWPVFYDNAGRGQGYFRGVADSRDKRSVDYDFSGEDLTPGVWEIVARGARSEARDSVYDLEASFSAFAVDPPVLKSMDFDAPASSPEAKIAITPLFDEVFAGHIDGSIDSYQRERKIEVKNDDHWSYDFELSDEVPSVDFTLKMSQEVYNLMTDVPVNIYDSKGKALVVDGFNQQTLRIGLHAASPDTYTLKVDAGFAMAKDKADWGFCLRENFQLAKKVGLSGKVREKSRFHVYPQAQLPVELTAEGVPPQAPDGFVNGGELRLVDEADGGVKLKIPVRLSH